MNKREAHWVHDDKGGYWQIPVGGEPYNFRTPPGFVMLPKGEAVTDAEILWDMRHIGDHLKYSEDAASMLIQGVRRVLRRVMCPTEAPVEAHCTTCSCVPGMTPAVRFDATPAEKEGAVRDHLIRMGWTPPAEAQAQGDAFCDGHCTWLDHAPGCPRYEAAPPSTPVGVEELIVDWESDLAEDKRDGVAEVAIRVQEIRLDQLRALAQQPAPVTPVGVVLTAKEREWLEYAVDHMAGDSEPEDAICYEVLHGLMTRVDALAQQPAAVDGELGRAGKEAVRLLRVHGHDCAAWELEGALADLQGGRHD